MYVDMYSILNCQSITDNYLHHCQQQAALKKSDTITSFKSLDKPLPSSSFKSDCRYCFLKPAHEAPAHRVFFTQQRFNDFPSKPFRGAIIIDMSRQRTVQTHSNLMALMTLKTKISRDPTGK